MHAHIFANVGSPIIKSCGTDVFSHINDWWYDGDLICFVFWVNSSSLDVLLLYYFFLSRFLLWFFFPFLLPYSNYYDATGIFFVAFLGNHFLALHMVEYLGRRQIGQILECCTYQSFYGSVFRNDILKVWSVSRLSLSRHWNRAEQH